jgi:tripartite-type tricarboxylate transporter receptor subunit TctC
MPRAIVDKLGAEMKRILDLPDIKVKFFDIGAVPAPNTPEAFAAFIAEERAKWQEVIKAAGVKLD